MPLFGVDAVAELVEQHKFAGHYLKEAQLAVRAVEQHLGLVPVETGPDCEVVRLWLIQLVRVDQCEVLGQHVGLLLKVRSTLFNQVQLLGRVRN